MCQNVAANYDLVNSVHVRGAHAGLASLSQVCSRRRKKRRLHAATSETFRRKGLAIKRPPFPRYFKDFSASASPQCKFFVPLSSRYTEPKENVAKCGPVRTALAPEGGDLERERRVQWLREGLVPTNLLQNLWHKKLARLGQPSRRAVGDENHCASCGRSSKHSLSQNKKGLKIQC